MRKQGATPCRLVSSNSSPHVHGMPDTFKHSHIAASGRIWIRRWLILIGLMVYAMILIGGATRLTDSGLSITEWMPLRGTVPPLSDTAWLSEFEKFRQTAEFQQQNYNLTRAEFGCMYWGEGGHRLLGRWCGVVAIGGFIWFGSQGWLTRKWGWRLAGLIGLGGLQGFIGWWMVASGLGETARLDVAPYRLMTHFGLALLIIAITAWFWLDLGSQRSTVPVTRHLHGVAWALLILVSLQMLSGALVAGLDAGRSYTDWPLMAGEWVPGNYLSADLGWRSLFEGRAATQFNHRFGAYLLFGLCLCAAWWYRRSPERGLIWSLAALVSLQAVWGVYTLMQTAPLPLALIHQGLGVIILLLCVGLVWRSQTPLGKTGGA